MKKRPRGRTRKSSALASAALLAGCSFILLTLAQDARAQADAQGVSAWSAYAAVTRVRALARTDSVRTLAEYYARRAYPGAPPMIPHDLTDDASYGARTCNRCHTRSRFVPRYQAYTPKTPHPELLSCRSCHVRMVASDRFRETGWITPDPPVLAGGVLDGSPPAIPHTLQLRESCVTCHAGPGSVPEIRSDHPDRENCRQCHVASESESVWVR